MKTQPRTPQFAAAANANNETSIRFGAMGVGLCLAALVTVASVIWAVGYEPALAPSAPTSAADAQIEEAPRPALPSRGRDALREH